MDLGRRSRTWDTCALGWWLPLGTGLEPVMCIMSLRLRPNLYFFFLRLTWWSLSRPHHYYYNLLYDFWSLLIFPFASRLHFAILISPISMAGFGFLLWYFCDDRGFGT